MPFGKVLVMSINQPVVSGNINHTIFIVEREREMIDRLMKFNEEIV